MLDVAGEVEKPKFIPDADAEYIANRTYLRVPLSPIPLMPPRSAPPVWLVQLAHLKVSNNNKKPSYFPSSSHDENTQETLTAKPLKGYMNLNGSRMYMVV